MAIADQTIDVDVFETIRVILVGASLEVTNSTTAATTSASIVAKYSDKTLSKPQVVILPTSYDESNYKFGDPEGQKFINVFVECYYKNTLGIDQLASQVAYAVKHASIDGMELVGVTTEYAFDLTNNNKYHMKMVQFVFDRE